MKYRDYQNQINESLKPSIDDSDVLNILQKYSIQNDRTKKDNGSYLYKFDNRYSIIYDGSTFVLYRHEDRIHMENARNLKEIDDAISKWLSAYSLDSVEVKDVEDESDEIDKLVNKMSKNAEESGDDVKPESDEKEYDDAEEVDLEQDDDIDDDIEDDKDDKK